MCLKNLKKLEDGTIFLADSHFCETRLGLDEFLTQIKNGEIPCKSLVFLGDIFEFISGESKYFIKIYAKEIALINELAKTKKVYYFEGNHDYNMQKLFPNIKVYKRNIQPVNFAYESKTKDKIKVKTLSISHGDINTGFIYNVYCAVIRNTLLMHFINFFDFKFFISKETYNALKIKSICKKMNDFKTFAKKRIKDTKVDTVLEGHFHQGKIYDFGDKMYINAPSFFCQNQYLVLEHGAFKNIDFKSIDAKSRIK